MSLPGGVDGGNQVTHTDPYTAAQIREQQISHILLFPGGSSFKSSGFPQPRVVDSHGVHGLRRELGLAHEDLLPDQPWKFIDIAELVDIELSTAL